MSLGKPVAYVHCSIISNLLISVGVELVVFAVFYGLQEITGRLFTDNRFVTIKAEWRHIPCFVYFSTLAPNLRSARMRKTLHTGRLCRPPYDLLTSFTAVKCTNSTHLPFSRPRSLYVLVLSPLSDSRITWGKHAAQYSL